MRAKALIPYVVLITLALPAVAVARANTTDGVAPSGVKAPCRDRPDPEAIIEQARADGFTIASGARESLLRVPDVGGRGRILVGYKGPRKTAVRTLQSAKRATASDSASLGCPVGSAAHTNWTSGGGVVQEYWHWATIGGQVGTSSPAAGSCPYTTCNWYAWINGVPNRYYRSVSVYNLWYAFILNAACGY